MKKTIWDIKDALGNTITDGFGIAKEAVHYFSDIYRKTGINNLQEQMKIIQVMPRLFSEEDCTGIFAPVTLEEIAFILKDMECDKSLGPDGWTCEFFTQFFDILGPELVRLVDEARVTGRILAGVNATFFSLIPKTTNPSSFKDFRRISLCNLIYKLISKTIALRIKEGLSNGISEEQFGFLNKRLIFDAVGTAQEVLHSIKLKKMEALALNLDLTKAYNLVDWSFLRLLLLNAGLDYRITQWIMGYINSTNLAILVNGCPSTFFQASRGLRQGCPLSPLLFILIIVGLSRLILQAKEEGHFFGIRTSAHMVITHLLFVYDILIFGMGKEQEWLHFKYILDTFCLAAGM